MEKYGVEVQETDQNKQASTETICPVCASKLELTLTGVKKCPECGTLPFEEK